MLDKFTPQHNGKKLSLQYSKMTRQQSENAEDWKGHLRLTANECGSKKETEGSNNNSYIVNTMKKW